MNENASTLLQLWSTMRAKRHTEQYDIIMECRQSRFFDQSFMEDTEETTKHIAAMELQIGKTVLRIINQTDLRLLEQILKFLGAFSC